MVFLGAVVAIVFPTAAFGANFSTYVGCSTLASAAPSHVCEVGDEPGAFFESPDAEVEYEVCVTFPDAETLCAEEEIADEGVLFVNAITTDLAGDYLVNWYVEGVEVAEWTFRMNEPTPPTPPVTPVVIPPTPPVVVQPPGPTPACLKSSRRVLKLQAQLKTTKAPKAKKALRKRLRGAKSTRKAAC